MAAGLDPDAEPLVPVQQHTARSHDDGRRGDVDTVGMLVERPVQPAQLGLHAGERRGFARVDRSPRLQLSVPRRQALVDGGQVASASYGGVSPGCNGT